MGTDISACELHLPHKDWATRANLPNADFEEQNYRELERWSIRLQDCVSGCTCHVEYADTSVSVPNNATLVVPRPDPGGVILCGTPDYTHMVVAFVYVSWDGNTTGIRWMRVTYVGTNTGFAWGQTQPGMIVPPTGGMQYMSVSRIMPNHVAKNYQLDLYQNSGGPLNASIRFEEYYPCCPCDWTYAC